MIRLLNYLISVIFVEEIKTNEFMYTDTSYLGRYVNPYTDFGFKWLFGTEVNKELLIGFLNALLDLDSPIKDITYHNTERLGDTSTGRKAVFDVYCESEDGKRFIVEMQKGIQQFFVDRSIYYASFPIRDQAPKGKDWNFKLAPVYAVGILNFVFDYDSPDYFHHTVQLMDTERKKVFYEKLTFIYLEMPKFTKSIGECTSFLDKWLYVLKNLVNLMSRPVELQERVFHRLFQTAEVAHFNPEQRADYEESLKNYRDVTNVVDTAREEGREEGCVEGERRKAVEVAHTMLQMGMGLDEIVKISGLSVEEIKKLK